MAAKDGQLDFADNRLAQGSCGRQLEFGSTAPPSPVQPSRIKTSMLRSISVITVHLTANASKSVVRFYYGRPPAYTYFEGCSTSGRQDLMEAQRYPRRL